MATILGSELMLPRVAVNSGACSSPIPPKREDPKLTPTPTPSITSAPDPAPASSGKVEPPVKGDGGSQGTPVKSSSTPGAVLAVTGSRGVDLALLTVVLLLVGGALVYGRGKARQRKRH